MLTSAENVHYAHTYNLPLGEWEVVAVGNCLSSTHTHTGVNAHENEGTKSR